MNHAKINKLLPVVLALLSIVLFTTLILQHEKHLQQGRSIYVELQPVDPRSILQGDYMALDYDLKLHDMNQQQIRNQSKVVSYVYLDMKHRVLKTRLDEKDTAAESTQVVKLILKNPNNQLDSLYPAANSFLFAEGLEPCYAKAKYAHLRVQPSGQALLAGLVDARLQSLNCEQQQKWSEGTAG